jgi:hypothetical protein
MKEVSPQGGSFYLALPLELTAHLTPNLELSSFLIPEEVGYGKVA